MIKTTKNAGRSAFSFRRIFVDKLRVMVIGQKVLAKTATTAELLSFYTQPRTTSVISSHIEYVLQ